MDLDPPRDLCGDDEALRARARSGKAVEYFPVLERTYTREQPNALTASQLPVFLAKMKGLYPQYYAMTCSGIGIGSRPSTLRPLRRSGPESDIDWRQGFVFLRRSNPSGDEIRN